MKRVKGFTLIELMATIAILAIVLIIAVPKINDYINKRKEDTFIANAKNIIRQLEYDNIENKFEEEKKLSEFHIDKLPDNLFDLDKSKVYVIDYEIYIDLVGINNYKNMYLCKISSSTTDIIVRDMPC